MLTGRKRNSILKGTGLPVFGKILFDMVFFVEMNYGRKSGLLCMNCMCGIIAVVP